MTREEALERVVGEFPPEKTHVSLHCVNCGIFECWPISIVFDSGWSCLMRVIEEPPPLCAFPDYGALCPKCSKQKQTWRPVVKKVNRSTTTKWLMANLDTARISNIIARFTAGVNTGNSQAVVEVCEHKVHTTLQNLSRHVAEKFLEAANTWLDKQNSDMLVLPQDCRLVFRQGKSLVLVIEQPPQTRSIRYNGAKKVFRLALPYVLFIMTYDGATVSTPSVAFRPAPINGPEDILYYPSLPNIEHNSLKPCMGGAWEKVTAKFPNQSMSEQVSGTIQHYWASEFTDAWSDNLKWYQLKYRETLGSFDAWARASEKNPLFFLKLEMNPHGPLSKYIRFVAEAVSKTNRGDLCSALMGEVNRVVNGLVKEIEEYLEGRVKEFKVETDIHEEVCAAVENIVVQALEHVMDEADDYIRDAITQGEHEFPDWRRDFHREGW